MTGHRLLMVLAVALFGCGPCHDYWAEARAAREEEARTFASHVPGASGSTCMEIDSDGGGYVSCTVFRESAPPIGIECAARTFLSPNRGCRMQRSSRAVGE